MKTKEKGAALVELTIIIPLLMLVFMLAVYEVGSILVCQQKLNQVVNEAVRLGSRTSALASGVSTSTDTGFGAVAVPTHVGMHVRAAEMISYHQMPVRTHTTTTELRQKDDCGILGCPPSSEDTVIVEVTARYNSLFPFPFDNWPLRVRRTAPWLYGDGLAPAVP